MVRVTVVLLALALRSALLAAQATVEVLPGHPTSQDALEFVVTGSAQYCWPALLTLQPAARDGEIVTLPATTPPGPLPPGCTPGWPRSFTLAALPAGSYSAEFRLDGVRYGAAAFQVVDPPPRLELQEHRLAVSARFVDPRDGREAEAHALQLSDAAGNFWFFSPNNVELTVKILDGRAINGAYWIFIASMTNLAYTVAVERLDVVCLGPCGGEVYESPAGVNRNFIDVNLFRE